MIVRLHHIPDYPFTRPFEKWLGFPLTPRQRTLVTILEHQRTTTGRVRLMLAARHAPKPDIARTLTLYLRWLQERITPWTQALAIERDRLTAWRLARELPRATFASARRIDQARGRTFEQLLILNAHLFCPNRRPVDTFQAAVTNYFPAIPLSSGSLIMVYGSIYRRRSSFSDHYRRHAANPRSPFVTITEAFLDLTPQEALQILWPREPIPIHQTAPPAPPAEPPVDPSPPKIRLLTVPLLPYTAKVSVAAATTAQAA